MKERPINLKAWEVRAFREGRKTQIRRVVKPRVGWPKEDGEDTGNPSESSRWIDWGPCQLGKPGDRLWARETWQAWRLCSVEYDEWDVCDGPPSTIHERYSNPKVEYAATSECFAPWRPSTQMPRWASRLTLEIVSARVERVQEISEEDAVKMGIENMVGSVSGEPGHWKCYTSGGTFGPKFAKESFRTLWESDNSPDSWTRNDWVWVAEVKEVGK